MPKKLLNYILWIYLSGLFILNVIPDVPAPEIRSGDEWIRLDYALHFMMYFIAGFLLYYNQKPAKRLSIVLFLAAMITYAVISEVLQLWVPGRTFNPVDLDYNILGVSTGLIIPLFILRNNKTY